jgi:Tetratricopeptide repeat
MSARRRCSQRSRPRRDCCPAMPCVYGAGLASGGRSRPPGRRGRLMTRSARRRVNGDGSITRRADGCWMGRYYAWTSAGTRKRVTVYGKDPPGSRGGLRPRPPPGRHHPHQPGPRPAAAGRAGRGPRHPPSAPWPSTRPSTALADARATLHRALAIFETAYGPDHPQVAMTLGNLGNVQQLLPH